MTTEFCPRDEQGFCRLALLGRTCDEGKADCPDSYDAANNLIWRRVQALIKAETPPVAE